MASELARPGLLFGVMLRALLLALLLTALIHLLGYTHYYATALVVALCSALVVADLGQYLAREARATERFLEALSASALETPVQRSAIPTSLRQAYDRTLRVLGDERQQQRRAAEYLRALLDTVPAGLVVLRADGSAELVNRAAHRLLGEAGPQLAQLPSLGREAATQLIALPPGANRIVQLANGRRLLASASQFTTPGSPAQRLICLQRLAGDLDAVSLTAWDDMARVLAHEMMNSLTPIASLSQSLDGLLRGGGPREEVSAALETIMRRSQGLLRFVERYREVAALPEPQPRELQLVDLLQGVERLVRPSLEQRGIALATSVTPGQLTARMDPDLLEQALINLLRNAADAAASEAQPRVGIDGRLEEDRCIIEVFDNGPGIEPAQREQVFVPFYTTKPGGSGIGLSLARRIAQAHGGQVSVHSREPRGTVFKLSLPL